MRLSKAMLWTVGSLVMAGAGLIYQSLQRYRDQVFDEKLVQQELEVLEGEGGICLS